MDGTTLNSTFMKLGNKVEAAVNSRRERNQSAADEMKAIHKARLSRKVFQDPSLASKLVVAQNSPVYNTRGELLQAVSTNLGNV